VTDERLSELDALADAATPGPWLDKHWHDDEEMPHTVVYCGPPGARRRMVRFVNLDDAAFVAAARAAIPELVAEVRRLRPA
jgi:hypothetical protein